MKRISFGTIVGFLLGLGLFMYSIFISTDNYFIFINVASFVMVFGGTIAATMISYKGEYVWESLKRLFRYLRQHTFTEKQSSKKLNKLLHGIK